MYTLLSKPSILFIPFVCGTSVQLIVSLTQEKEKVKQRKFGTNYVRHLLLNPCTGSRGLLEPSPSDTGQRTQRTWTRPVHQRADLYRRTTTHAHILMALHQRVQTLFGQNTFKIGFLHFLVLVSIPWNEVAFSKQHNTNKFSLFNQFCKPHNKQPWKTFEAFRKRSFISFTSCPTKSFSLFQGHCLNIIIYSYLFFSSTAGFHMKQTPSLQGALWPLETKINVHIISILFN